MLSVGEQIGSYQIVSELSVGGMATLFLGRRTGAAGFARPVAVKVVHAHLARDPRFVRMLIDEAMLAARIAHPNVVHVEELGEARGTYFLVMEYVHGCALSQLLALLARNKLRLAPELAAWIAIQAADGLHAAHETRDDAGEALGLVHRDVSPQNVLLSYRGHVKLIDFGIAKARGREQFTGAGTLKGKLAYMSPEQSCARPLDRRADVYALGVVLWEMLAMRRLFHAPTEVELLDQVRRPRVEPPSRFVPGVPAALDAVVMAALAPERDARIGSARELRMRLAEAVPGALALDGAPLAELLHAVSLAHAPGRATATASAATQPTATLDAQVGVTLAELPASAAQTPDDDAVFDLGAARLLGEDALEELLAPRAQTASAPAMVAPVSPVGADAANVARDAAAMSRDERGAARVRRGRRAWGALAAVAAVVVAVSGGAIALRTRAGTTPALAMPRGAASLADAVSASRASAAEPQRGPEADAAVAARRSSGDPVARGADAGGATGPEQAARADGTANVRASRHRAGRRARNRPRGWEHLPLVNDAY